MKFTRPNTISVNISIFITAIFILIFVITSLTVYNEILWWVLITSSFGIFISAFFFVKYSVEKFIYEKIRPIYKTIHNLKAPKGKENKQPETNGDMISSVNQQVMKWVEDNKEEIDNLRKTEAYRREFLGNVSHELKTPIFNIQGYILTLLDGGLDDPTINKEYLLRTEKSINRMINIVQDLETIANLETGEQKPRITRFDMIALVKEVFNFLEITAKKRNITFYFDKNYEKPVVVAADKEKIRQVLTNLLDNSVKYGNENGSTKVSFFDMDENVLIEVTDNGIGVAPQDIPRLFERFFRIDKSRSREQGGTGLGLAIVKHIIEAHQQTINVRSTQGVGTTFAFTLKKG
jgi:two-component system, OmpR family, phosphate regulon sensor histidine kinase PhoR